MMATTISEINDARYYSKLSENVYLEIIHRQRNTIDELHVVVNRLKDIIRRNNIVHNDIDLITGLSDIDLSMLGRAIDVPHTYHPSGLLHPTTTHRGLFGRRRPATSVSLGSELADLERDNANLVANITGSNVTDTVLTGAHGIADVSLAGTYGTVDTSTTVTLSRAEDRLKKAREFNITENQVDILDLAGRKPESGVPPAVNDRLDAIFKNAGIIDNRIINSLLTTFPKHFERLSMHSDSY
jgi:hypothetical protein